MPFSEASAFLQAIPATPLFLNLGVPELSIIFILVLILFGPGKLPGVMKSLGEGIRQFKDASSTDRTPRVSDRTEDHTAGPAGKDA